MKRVSSLDPHRHSQNQPTHPLVPAAGSARGKRALLSRDLGGLKQDSSSKPVKLWSKVWVSTSFHRCSLSSCRRAQEGNFKTITATCIFFFKSLTSNSLNDKRKTWEKRIAKCHTWLAFLSFCFGGQRAWRGFLFLKDAGCDWTDFPAWLHKTF